MKPSLQLSMSQRLSLTPQLRQSIHILQLSAQELQQTINEQLEMNPLLESQESHEQQASSLEQEAWEKLYQPGATRHQIQPNYEQSHAEPISLKEHLRWQLNLSHLSALDETIALFLIDAVDNDGFLTLSLKDIQNSIRTQTQQAVEMDEIIAVKHRLQRFEPLGCCSEDLQDSLSVQISESTFSPEIIKLAKSLIQNDLELLASHNYNPIIKYYGVNEETLKCAIECVKSLNPRPGSAILSETSNWLIPDIIVKKSDAQWVAFLNPQIHRNINVNENYVNLIRETNSEQKFLNTHLQTAKGFIKSLQDRYQTLLKVSQTIVKYQQDFFQYGVEKIKPMVLADIACELNLHESTISRATTHKYIYCPHGLLELRYFFSSHVNTQNGMGCSSKAILAKLKQLIDAEPAQKPLSDSKIAALFEQDGIYVARRTIAKYRESLGIPPSHERKILTTS